jgi:kynureninase
MTGSADRRPEANLLALHYTRFRVAERLLLTGHSHQAWPDCGFAAQQQAWLDAAELVDDKWERAFAVAGRVRAGIGALLEEAPERIALGQNTFELVARFLSALPLAARPRLVTTDGEFHTIRRLLDRLAEERVEVVKIAAEPVDDLTERVARAIDDRTAAALVSTVQFQTARIVPNLEAVGRACARHGAELLLDAYHHLGVVPWARSAALAGAWVTGGGYKYLQLGEGAGFLRVPPHCTLRPVLTGWFAEFATLAASSQTGQVAYGKDADRFAGATYDPTSQYRAAAVLDFFVAQGLTPARLRAISQHQIGLLCDGFDALDAAPALADRDRSAPREALGGFLVIRSPLAGALGAALRQRGVLADHRGAALRLGPAPYLADAQLTAAIGHLGECLREAAARHGRFA